MTACAAPVCFWKVDKAASAQYRFDLGGISLPSSKSGAELSLLPWN